MRLVRALAALALAAALLAGCAGPRGGSPVSRTPPFSVDPRWDDGRAEVSLYTGTTVAEAEVRPTDARIVLFRQVLGARTLAPVDSAASSAGTVECLRMIAQADLAEGAENVHQTVALALRRADLEPLQESASHTDGRGVTFVRLARRDGRLTRTSYSYADGDGVTDVPEPAGERMWADALPVALRAWAGETEPFERRVWLLPGQLGAHTPTGNARPVEARVRLVGTVPLSVPDGAYEARQFTVTTERGTDLYWFDAEAPHVLLKLETATGRKLELVNTLRIATWEHTSPGDERLLLE